MFFLSNIRRVDYTDNLHDVCQCYGHMHIFFMLQLTVSSLGASNLLRRWKGSLDDSLCIYVFLFLRIKLIVRLEFPNYFVFIGPKADSNADRMPTPRRE